MEVEAKKRRGLQDLPLEIMEEVLSRLPLHALRRCMLLSRRIYGIITSLAFYERWIMANLMPHLILISQNTQDEDEDALMNSIHTLDLRDFDQPQLPLNSGLVEIPNPLPSQDTTLTLHGSSKGLVLLGLSSEGQVQQLHLWNPFLRLLGPAIALPPGFDGQPEVGFGYARGEFHVLLISPPVEGAMSVQVLKVSLQQVWISISHPMIQLSANSVLCHSTTNALRDGVVLWSVRDGTARWSIQGFNFATRSFIPSIHFPVWENDGERSLPILKIFGDAVYAYRAATADGGDADPVAVWRLREEGDWEDVANFNVAVDLSDDDDDDGDDEDDSDDDDVREVCDMFKEVVAMTNEYGRLFLYTSEDHLMGYDQETKTYFFFGYRGDHYERIDSDNYPELPDLRVAAYHPSFMWPYSRFAGEGN